MKKAKAGTLNPNSGVEVSSISLSLSLSLSLSVRRLRICRQT
ncbi:hypothetical protein CsSME_00025900 [Camellia sinensis var. sinensis]